MLCEEEAKSRRRLCRVRGSGAEDEMIYSADRYDPCVSGASHRSIGTAAASPDSAAPLCHRWMARVRCSPSAHSPVSAFFVFVLYLGLVAHLLLLLFIFCLVGLLRKMYLGSSLGWAVGPNSVGLEVCCIKCYVPVFHEFRFVSKMSIIRSYAISCILSFMSLDENLSFCPKKKTWLYSITHIQNVTCILRNKRFSF